jgi:FkbM family methyltransferase
MKTEANRSKSLSDFSIQVIRGVTRIWPLEAGKDLPTHFGAFAAKVGLLKPVWYEFQPGLRMCLNIRDLIHQTILIEGCWDPQLTPFVKEHLHRGSVFVDIGAHSGYFSLLAGKEVGPTGVVLAIEPSPKAAQELRLNIEASNLENVIVEEVACSDLGEPTFLYLHNDSNSSMSSLSSRNVSDGEKVRVECVGLDALAEKHALHRVDLIKIDVEGAELGVLRSGRRTIEKFLPVIVLELDPALLKGFDADINEALDWFKELGYDVKPMGGHNNYACYPSK